MQAPTGNSPPSRPALMKFLVRSWEYRHPRVWVRLRLAAGIWNLGLSILLLASGRWIGSFAWLGAVPMAGAAMLFWSASRLQHGVQA